MPPSNTKNEQQALSRRELLKTLTALGGAVAASSLLPRKWSQPKVGAGVLPVHAQGTLCEPPYEITECDIGAPVWVANDGVALIFDSTALVAPACPDVLLSASPSFYNANGGYVGPGFGGVFNISTNANGLASYSFHFPEPGNEIATLEVKWSLDTNFGNSTCTTQRVNVPSPPSERVKRLGNRDEYPI